MSQNRNDKDYANIITQLHQETSAEAHRVAQEMKKLRLKNACVSFQWKTGIFYVY